MDLLPDLIRARQEEITAWLAPGLDIDMLVPTPVSPSYRAMLPEFDLIGEGATEDEAINALMMRFSDFLTTSLLNDAPLPDRRGWLAAHPDRPTDGGNGR